MVRAKRTDLALRLDTVDRSLGFVSNDLGRLGIPGQTRETRAKFGEARRGPDPRDWQFPPGAQL
jgi:hypothetical protein